MRQILGRRAKRGVGQSKGFEMRRSWRRVFAGLLVSAVLLLSSTAFANWEKVLGGTGWSARTLHTLVEYEGEYVQMGGAASLNPESGLWHSDNGSTWTAVDDPFALTFMDLRGHASVTFNGKLWNLGGDHNSFYNNQVGSFITGEPWESVGQAAWGPRAYHRAVVFNGKMWVMGGENGIPTSLENIVLNDVWFSEDGMAWTQATANAGWAPRADFNLVTLGARMYVFGGAGYEPIGSDWVYLNDVWSSADGVNWTQESASAPWSARWGATAVVANNKIVLAGGRSASGYLNDLWTSTNGQTWTAQGTAPWGVRAFHAMALGTGTAGEEILLTGGRAAGSIRYDDAWASTDGGANWVRRSTLGAPWAGPIMEGRPQLYSFNGQLWSLAKSFDQAPNPPAERLWSSADGEDWVLAASSFPWVTMTGTITEFQGKVWALGSQHSDSSYRVCSSVDGINWTVASTTGWNGGYAIAAAVQGGALWALVEEWNETFTERVVELRRSTNGLTWTTITPAGSEQPEWDNRYASSSMLSYLGKLYVSVNYVDSVNGQYVDERGVWSSTNGINWTRVTDPYVPAPGPDNVQALGLIGIAHDRMWAWGPGGSLWSSSDGGDWYAIDEPWQSAGWPATFAWFNDRLWVETQENGGLTDDLFAFSPIIHVNFSHTGAEEGTLALPYNTLTEAVNAASWDHKIQLAAGTSNETMLITKRLRIGASGGTVRIGVGAAKASTALTVPGQPAAESDSGPAFTVHQHDQPGLARGQGIAGIGRDTDAVNSGNRLATAVAEGVGAQRGLGVMPAPGSGSSDEDDALVNEPAPFGGCIGAPGGSPHWLKQLGDLFTLLTGFGLLVFMRHIGGSGRD